MKTVWMAHPGVAVPAEVPESAVPHWRSRGWAPALGPEKPAAPADENEAGEDKARDKPRGSRRRGSEESE